VQWLEHRDRKLLRAFLIDSYRPRDLPAFARHVVASLPAIIPAELAGYLTFNRQIPRVTWLTSPADAVPPGADRIMERLIGGLPVTSHRLRTGDASALKICDFLNRAQFRRLPLYNEVLRPLRVEHEVGIALSVGPVSSTAVALYRATRDFAERDRLLLDVLRPHLAQAHEAARTVSRMSDRTPEGGLPRPPALEVIALDAESHGAQMSRRGHAWLGEHFGVRLPRASLPEPFRLWIVQQEEALRQVADDLPLPRRPLIVEGRDTRLAIRLLSGGDERVLIVERIEPVIRPASLGDRFALTEREAEVLAWIAQGKSNSEVAAIVSAQPRTIEKHLERVYRKLGVDNRFAAAMLAVVAEGNGG